MNKILFYICFLVFATTSFCQQYPKLEKIDVIPKEHLINASEYNNSKSNVKSKYQNPLFILNGKIITSDSIYKIKPNFIKNVFVLKNKNATDKYGEKGKNGVIEIITKKENL